MTSDTFGTDLTSLLQSSYGVSLAFYLGFPEPSVRDHPRLLKIGAPPLPVPDSVRYSGS